MGEISHHRERDEKLISVLSSEDREPVLVTLLKWL